MKIDEAIKVYEEGTKHTWNGKPTVYAEECQQMVELLKELQAHREAWEKVKSELWMEGMNMTGEYKGVWIRYRDIERVIDANRPKEGDAE